MERREAQKEETQEATKTRAPEPNKEDKRMRCPPHLLAAHSPGHTKPASVFPVINTPTPI